MDDPTIQVILSEKMAVCIVLVPQHPYPQVHVEAIVDPNPVTVKYMITRTYQDATQSDSPEEDGEQPKKDLHEIIRLLPVEMRTSPQVEMPTSDDLVRYRRGMAMAEAQGIDLAPFEIGGKESRAELLKLGRSLLQKINERDGR